MRLGAEVPRMARFPALLALLLAAACTKAPSPGPAPADPAPHVHEFAWVSKQIARGAQPEGDEAFRELAALGIRTVVSVDGARPDVEGAKRHGLRYVHIPFGYDGVPEAQREEIAKTVRELPGPFFIHCHHGKHRGPVGAVLAQMALGGMSNEQAEAELVRAGTGENYRGLWKCAREFVPPPAAETAALAFDFPETAPVEGMMDAMARLDRIWDRLKLCRTAGWKVPADHPDVDPPHEALQMLECFVETSRTDGAKDRGEAFLALLAQAVDGSRALEAELRKTPVDPEAADAALKRVDQACARCHSDYRNNVTK